MPATWPRIQFPGSGFGQNGSGWNFGGRVGLGRLLCECRGGTSVPAMVNATIAKTRRMVASLVLCVFSGVFSRRIGRS